MVQECVNKCENTLKERAIGLSVQFPSTELRIISDQKKVLQIFQNLFQNAIKFTPQGQITVKADLSAKKDSVVIEIIDTGIGFPQNEIDSMVESFRQLDSSSRREFSGLGLGLTISRQLTDLLGGTLHITSEPGIGTHIVLTLPLQLKDQKDDRPH